MLVIQENGVGDAGTSWGLKKKEGIMRRERRADVRKGGYPCDYRSGQ